MVPNLIRMYRARTLLKVNEKMMENRRMKIYYRSGALKVSNPEKQIGKIMLNRTFSAYSQCLM